MKSKVIRDKLVNTIHSCVTVDHISICTNWYVKMAPKMKLEDGVMVYETLHYKRKEILQNV